MKCKFTLILETMRARAILMKFLTHRVSAVYWRVFPKIVFLPFFAAILNFCVKRKIAFILETVQFRQMFDPQTIQRVMWRLFPKVVFRLEFLIKLPRRMYLRSSVRQSNFGEIFDEKGICRAPFSQKSFSRHFWWSF